MVLALVAAPSPASSFSAPRRLHQRHLISCPAATGSSSSSSGGGDSGGAGSGGGGSGSGGGGGVRLDVAASTFAKAVGSGAAPDDVVAQQLGASSAAELTGVAEQYKDQIKRKLEAVSCCCLCLVALPPP